VVDPMAGGGVVGDVCKAMKREYKMYDIDPKRDDIIKRNISHVSEAADLVFWDPPYYKKIADQYVSESISSLPRTEYLKVFYEAAENFANVGVKKVALLMSDYDDEYNGKPEENIFIHHYINAFEHTGKWRVYRIIQCPLSSSQIPPTTINIFKEKKKLARITRNLIIFVRTRGEALQ
jgi:DNA modification methylase